MIAVATLLLVIVISLIVTRIGAVITRSDGRYLGVPTGDTRIEPGDVLVIYGQEDQLVELDDRPAGKDGDLAHEAAVARQRRNDHART